MKTKLMLIAFVCLMLFRTAQAQHAVVDLFSIIQSGTVTLTETKGTGASSGSSVEGKLENQSKKEINIDVYLTKPIFLVNRGSGQNMIATQVYQSDGGYIYDGKRSFITLKPLGSSRVVFVAYCVNFERENPSTNETFYVDVPSSDLVNVMKNIINYERSNPNSNITAAAQVAVWLSQGVSTQKIKAKFAFTKQDEQLARSFLR